MRRALFALALAGSLACSQDSGQRPPETPQQPPHPTPTPAAPPSAAPVRLDPHALRAAAGLLCLTPESLVAFPGGIQFGESASDSTTGDVSGLFFRFSLVDSGVVGLVLEATGEVGEPQPFTELQLDPRNGAISFSGGDSLNRFRFSGRFSCDRLRGRSELSPQQVLEGKVFRLMT